MKLQRLSLVIIVLTFAGLCFGQSAGIKKVDFKNFNYGQFCTGPHAFLVVNRTRLVLRNGHAEQGDESNYTDLGPVEYVDLDRDGKDEAFVVIKGQTSGSSNTYLAAFVFAYKNGKASSIWSKCEENSMAKLDGRTVVFTSPEWTKKDAHCCFSYVRTGTYGFKGAKFTLISSKSEKSGSGAGADERETIEDLAKRVSAAFTSRNLSSLDEGKPYAGSIAFSIEHSIADGTDRKSFTSFKSAAAWLMRRRRETNLQAGELTACKKGTCTFAENGMLHNSLYLRNITYTSAKGSPYIKTISFVDGD